MSEHGEDRGAGQEPGDRVEPGGVTDRPRAWLTGAGLGALVLAALVVAFVIGTNYSDEPGERAAATTEEVEELPQDLSGPGKDLFVASCGACHILADAGTGGTAGPDLDKLTPDAALVEQAIAQGGTGTGMMPPGLLTGDDATQVSEYVAAASGSGS